MEHCKKWDGGTRARGLMEDFKGALEDCRLSDLGAPRPKFTWHNGRQGSDFTKERLDRVVANQQWCEIFPYAEASVLANKASHHNPLLRILNV